LPSMEIISIKDGDLDHLSQNYSENKVSNLVGDGGEIIWEELGKFLGNIVEKEENVLGKRYRQLRFRKTEGKWKNRELFGARNPKPAKVITVDAVSEKEGSLGNVDNDNSDNDSDNNDVDNNNNVDNSRNVTTTQEEVQKDEKATVVEQQKPTFTWRENYYRYLFGPAAEDINFIDKVCGDYLLSLQWVMFYYRRGLSSWSWFYPHHFPPLFVDLQRYLRTGHVMRMLCDGVFGNVGNPFTPFEQLVAVLPPSSGKIALPAEFHHLFGNEGPLISFFPEKIPTFTDRRRSVVELPFIDEQELLKNVAALEKQMMDGDDLLRNKNLESPVVYTRIC